MGIRKGRPPFELVRLNQFPEHTWKGRAVFHPLLQVGDKPYWDENDYPELQDTWEEGDPPRATAYDVGVVLEWWDDEIHPGIPRVRFIGDSGSTLHYAADNLWTPMLEIEK